MREHPAAPKAWWRQIPLDLFWSVSAWLIIPALAIGFGIFFPVIEWLLKSSSAK
jgi:hypothetical protein